jgi:hypothetical protein
MSLKSKLAALSVAGMSLLAGSALAAPLPVPGQAMNTMVTPNAGGSSLLVRGGSGFGAGHTGGFGSVGGSGHPGGFGPGAGFGHAGSFGHMGGHHLGFALGGGPLMASQCNWPYNPQPWCNS